MKLYSNYNLGLKIGLACIIPFQSCIRQEDQQKPNIIIIYTDDQGTLDAGCSGLL